MTFITLPHTGRLLLLLLLATPLFAQEEADTRRVQWATAARVGMSFGQGSIEPPQTGSRLVRNVLVETDYEARFNKHWSAIAVLGGDFVWTYRDPSARAPGTLTDDPEFISHPFTSRRSLLFLRLGGQYNYRLGKGDLSVAASAGPAFGTYIRHYDYLRVSGNNLVSAGVVTDESVSTFNLAFSSRVQYTHWFARKFAVSAGFQALSFRYLSGGVDTPNGPRYELGRQESAALPVRYNVNYDITSLTPDPTLRNFSLGWFVGITQRL